MALHIFQKGTGNIAYTTAIEGAFQLEEVRLHLDAAGGSNSFTVSIDSAKGSEYNAVLNTQDMTSATDEIYQPTRPAYINAEDQLYFAWTNAGPANWGLEIIYQHT
jgi:hypothetical protein